MKFSGSAFFWVAFAMVVGGMSTALISPLYPVYQSQWQLQVSDISLIYVVYMLGALSSLLFLGRLADLLGFDRAMRVAIALLLGGTALTVLAWNIPSLLVGRFIVGVSASVVTIAGTVGLIHLSAEEAHPKVSSFTSVLLAFGFGLGPLLGGVTGQWVAYPLITTYIPILLLGLLVWVVLLRMPRLAPVPLPSVRRFALGCLPRLTWPEPGKRAVFVLNCCFPLVAFGVFGLYASMAPLFLEKMVSWHGPFISGGAIAAILIASAGTQLACSGLRAHVAGTLGLLCLAASNGLMIANLGLGWSTLFLLGVVLTAVGHGLTMLAGSNILNRLSQPHNRTGLVATLWVAGYVGTIVPMLAIGWIADHFGLPVAVTAFCSMIVIGGLCLAVATARNPLMRADERAHPIDTH
jgi:MFS family permease